MSLPSYVGRYEVRGEVAKGGFAVVVQAWDEELESIVAIKILHRDYAENEEVQVRFLEEARLLRRIRSPNVVTVHDVGRLNDGRPYFVMDFADRGTLAERLESRTGEHPPDAQSLAVLVDAVSDGLTALHEAGLVHRDIKPANTLLQLARRRPLGSDLATRAGDPDSVLISADERVLVGDLGIAKDLVKRGSQATLIGGTPLYEAPEQSDRDADITAAVDIYASTAMLWHVLTSERPPAPDRVSDSLDDVPPAWRAMLEQGMARNPKSRFASIEHWRSAAHSVLGGGAAKSSHELPTSTVPPAKHCPYKGLAAFQPEDARFFFGREALTDELVRRMHGHGVLVVGGPSGSGKSSLVRAGLIPALNAGALPGSECWPVALFTPGRDPLTELHFQVSRVVPSSAVTVSVDDLVARPTMARQLGRTEDTRQSLVLCIDQFEELFTLAPLAQRNKFVTALSAMADPGDSKVRIVIAVRADFYGACAQIPWLAERISDNQVLVGPMTGTELRRAISEPARPAGLYLEGGLVDAILDEAGNEAGSLPLVAHALVETWIRRQGNTLTLEGFRAAGGVAGAIGQTADATFAHRFDAAERDATKRMFLKLVTPGEGTPDTRRTLTTSEIDHDADPDVMHRIVDRLTEARLLTVDDASVQIAHEALLRTWPRLRRWIEESRDDLRTRQRISRAAEEWEAEGRDSDLLYHGTPLLSALEWANKHQGQISLLEEAFIEASAEFRARAESAKSERQRKTRRVRRAAVAVLSFLALGATVASVIAFSAFRQAQYNADLAEAATIEARERFAGALGATAGGLLNTEPLLALVLAAEAVARAGARPPTFDARATMIAARLDLADDGPFLFGSPIAAGDALAIAVSPDGALMASAQRDGRIDLIDIAARRPVGPSLQGHVGGVEDVEFSPDGRQLVSAGDDGMLRIWSVGVQGNGEGRIVGQVDDVIWGVRFGPRGAILASASQDGTVRLWDVANRAAMGEPLAHRTGNFSSLAFSPDGSGLVAGNNDGEIHAWALPSGKPLIPPIRNTHTSTIWKIAFSPTGDLFATASRNGNSMILAYPSGRIIGRAFEDVGQDGVEFTPDGTILVGGGLDGTVKLWDVKRQALIRATPSGHSQAIIDVELSGDGTLLATLGRDQLVRTWSFSSSHPLAGEKRSARRAVKGVAFSSDGKFVAAGDDSGAVHMWELGSTEDASTFSGHRDQVWALAFSRDGTTMASGDRAGQVRIWTAVDHVLRRSIVAHEDAVWWLDFSPDGDQLMTASDRGIRFWEVGTGALLSEWLSDGGNITRAALSPDGTLLAVVSTDGVIRLWNAKSKTIVKQITAAADVLWSVAFSPDSRVLATASSDEVVALWDVATGRQRAAFTGHSGGATNVAYLADGVTVVASDRGGRIHVWDAKTGRRLASSWQAHSGASWRLAVHPDGQRFATAGDDGWVKVWDELSVDRACEIGSSTFDAVRRDQYLGDGERSAACD